MLKLIFCLSIVGSLTGSTLANLTSNVQELADALNQKVFGLIVEISSLTESVEKQNLLQISQGLKQEIEKQKNSANITDLYLIEPQIAQLAQEVKKY